MSWIKDNYSIFLGFFLFIGSIVGLNLLGGANLSEGATLLLYFLGILGVIAGLGFLVFWTSREIK